MSDSKVTQKYTDCASGALRLDIIDVKRKVRTMSKELANLMVEIEFFESIERLTGEDRVKWDEIVSDLFLQKQRLKSLADTKFESLLSANIKD